MSVSTYVYVLQEEGVGCNAPIKIGVAKNVQKRIEQLQIGNPRWIVQRMVFGPMTCAAAYDLEAHIHRRFKKQRIRGEWFHGRVLGMITVRENGFPTRNRQ